MSAWERVQLASAAVPFRLKTAAVWVVLFGLLAFLGNAAGFDTQWIRDNFRYILAGLGKRVAIAWRDDARAAQAVLPELRCLGGAEQVHVLAGVRHGAGPPALPQILVDHGVGSELHVLPIGPGPFGQDLLNKAHELGADMLVMGAYAHSPLREALLQLLTHGRISGRPD